MSLLREVAVVLLSQRLTHVMTTGDVEREIENSILAAAMFLDRFPEEEKAHVDSLSPLGRHSHRPEWVQRKLDELAKVKKIEVVS